MQKKIRIYFPTNNIGKFERYKKSFEQKGIDYNRYLIDKDGNNIEVDVKEMWKTTRENAKIKAKAYYDKYKSILKDEGILIITTDEALYIDGLEKDLRSKWEEALVVWTAKEHQMAK